MAQKMAITGERLRTLGVGFKASFMRGLGAAPSMFGLIATVVPSSNAAEEYGWLGKVPGVREWIGDRVIQNVSGHGYTIKNRDFESTVGVDRNDIEDDNLGLYGPLFDEMGRGVNVHKDQLVFELFARGNVTPCYDGQNFFDTDHPVLAADGSTESVSNYQDGTGAPWFLIDDTRALKPVILQVRKEFEFVAKDNPTDDNVFHRREFQYGYDGRMNVGFGFWQFAFMSKAPLTAENYESARAALSGMRGDYGRPLGIRPTRLLVDPTNEGAGRRLLNNELGANGETNPWKGTAELSVVPWL